jgi:adenylate cyclase
MSSDNDWIKHFISPPPSPPSSVPSVGFANLLGGISSSLGGTPHGSFVPLYQPFPEKPKEWSSAYLKRIEDRVVRRTKGLDSRIDALALGRVMPDIEQITIGSGRQMRLAVLFLDICQFSSWASSDHDEQTSVLRVMNIFMAEMLNIIRDFGGTFEKNTGDGLMAYFGPSSSEEKEACEKAVTAASVMVYINDAVLTPWFQANQLWPVRFRVGINFGPVTLGKVGIPHLAEQFVAIGTSANIACKIMKLIPDGGICIGNEVRKALSSAWQSQTTQLGDTGFIYKASGQPYPAWEVTHRLSRPL